MNERIVLASFGPFLITAYSLCVSIGSLLAGLAVLWLGVRRRLALKTLLNMIICAVVGALLGARILYCAAMFDTISVDFGLDFIPRFWEGGYTLFGGVLGGLAAVCLYARVSKISAAALLDVAASGAAPCSSPATVATAASASTSSRIRRIRLRFLRERSSKEGLLRS